MEGEPLPLAVALPEGEGEAIAEGEGASLGVPLPLPLPVRLLDAAVTVPHVVAEGEPLPMSEALPEGEGADLAEGEGASLGVPLPLRLPVRLLDAAVTLPHVVAEGEPLPMLEARPEGEGTDLVEGEGASLGAPMPLRLPVLLDAALTLPHAVAEGEPLAAPEGVPRAVTESEALAAPLPLAEGGADALPTGAVAKEETVGEAVFELMAIADPKLGLITRMRALFESATNTLPLASMATPKG